jgi:excisionase family DNA binding protein
MNHNAEYVEVLKRRPVLRKKEYAILTGLSIPTITRLALNGEIPSRKVGRSVLLVNDLCR